ncbi:MAG: hypothetical protein H7840_11770 [Alphaproteobacteria bacterium]
MESIERCVKSHQYEILERANKFSNKLMKDAESAISAYLFANGEPADGVCGDGMCFVVVGSVGRREALEASDLDLIPVAIDEQRLEQYLKHDTGLREALRTELNVNVSKGEDLTKATSVQELVESESIGGDKDTSSRLTKRVLLLTESAAAGGKLPIRDVRRALLDAYASQNRTSGRHVLSLCNDIARYYKTLCVEYKAKVDDKDKDWCTRNIKLRHSRKLWYFSNIMTVVTLASAHPHGDKFFKDALLDSFDRSPMERLSDALSNEQPLALGQLLETYALYLEFMAHNDRREALKKVEHDSRYDMSINNPFPVMKFSSDIIHKDIMSIIEEMRPAMRSRIMSWFLL